MATVVDRAVLFTEAAYYSVQASEETLVSRPLPVVSSAEK